MIYHRNYRLPVIYVFGKKLVDVTDTAQKLLESYVSSNIPAKIVVFRHDVAYAHEAGASPRKAESATIPRQDVS